MKKMFAIIVTVVLCISLCACAGNGGGNTGTTGKPVISTEGRVRDAVSLKVKSYVMSHYDVFGTPRVTVYVSRINEYQFKATGQVTIQTVYAEYYTGSYDAVVKYNSLTDTYDVTDCNVGKLYRD